MIVRLRFGKSGKVRWTSHRDVARAWERALRRARLPVSYTAGFSPRPRLSFGLALPTGCESRAEYLDITLSADLEPETVAARLAPLLPSGIGVLAAGVPEMGQGSLQEEVTSCTWEMTVPGRAPDDIRRAVAAVMGAERLPIERERKGRLVSDDLRPALRALSVVRDDAREADRRAERRPGHVSGVGAPSAGSAPSAAFAHPLTEHTQGSGDHWLLAELSIRPRGVRPAELAQVMGFELGLVRRTHQWIERDGSRFEPLAERVAASADAKERAS